MGKRAYYRDYRPRKLSQVMGQPHITKTLQNAIDNSRFSHAYLFSGPRGVGKTSVARILAHEVNKLEYDDDSTHLDIIEIDAASNRRIDEIRDLRDKIGITPTSAKYKVYIIDEVHMLTKESFNALLKTLEEPPEHAIFILATTEAHRLPDTILSRTQRYSFKPISIKDLSNHLESIAKKEKVSIPKDALDLVAEHASGSFRDGLSTLDQLATAHDKKIALGNVRDSLGLAPDELVGKLQVAITDGDTQRLLLLLDKAYEEGTSAPMLAKQLIAHMQKQWSSGSSYSIELLLMSDKLLEVQSSSEPEIKLTIVLLEACLHNATLVSNNSEKMKIEQVTSVVASAQPSKATTSDIKSPENEEIVTPERAFDQEAWMRVLGKIKQTNNSLYAVLRMAEAGINGSDDVVVLTFQYAFHQKQVGTQRNKQIVESVLSGEVGQPIRVKLVVNKDLEGQTTEKVEKLVEKVDDDQLSSIMDIMGGGEVVNI